MVAESVASGEPDQLVAHVTLQRRPAFLLRRLECERRETVRLWLVSGGEVIATASLRLRGSYWYGHLGAFVRPTRRNQGIARALTADLVTRAHAAGVAAPLSIAEVTNAASRRAIQAAGGKLLETVTEYGITRCIYGFEPEGGSSGEIAVPRDTP
jgi:GNAT superfamily N-acetyltransferase